MKVMSLTDCNLSHTGVSEPMFAVSALFDIKLIVKQIFRFQYNLPTRDKISSQNNSREWF